MSRRYSSSEVTLIWWISAAVPRTRPMFAILLPTTFPTAKSATPFELAKTLTTDSGKLVPYAMIVSPTTNGGRPHLFARSTAPSTNQSDAMTENKAPKELYVIHQQGVPGPGCTSGAGDNIVWEVWHATTDKTSGHIGTGQGSTLRFKVYHNSAVPPSCRGYDHRILGSHQVIPKTSGQRIGLHWVETPFPIGFIGVVSPGQAHPVRV